MRTFIIAATSKDGFISNETHVNSFEWTSKEDKANFIELTKKAGLVIVGSKTYETFDPRFRPLSDRHNVVYSRSKRYEGKNVETASGDPGTLLEKLVKCGFTEAAIIGGREIYRMFLDADLVDRIHLTVEPIEFGSGIPFHTGYLESRFDIVTEQTVNDKGTIFREYMRKSIPAH
jgi:dihydrofolate reductase